MIRAPHVAGGQVQYLVAQTLDGYIAESDGGLEWLIGPDPASDRPTDATEAGAPPSVGCTIVDALAAEDDDSYQRFFDQVRALAMGSDTYRGIDKRHPDHWPYADVPSWVFTTGELAPPWKHGDIRRADGPVRRVLDEMRDAAGGRIIWLVGGGQLATQFADEHLLDELLVTIVPVVLGTGVPTFARRMSQHLVLTDAYALATGTVNLRYRFAHSLTNDPVT